MTSWRLVDDPRQLADLAYDPGGKLNKKVQASDHSQLRHHSLRV